MSNEIDLLFPKMVAHRRHLHQHPELSYKEFETTAYIIKVLSTLGYEIHRPLETGVVAVLNPEVKSSKVLAFRADIDALPISEEGDAKQAFLSKNPGVAHCCGHDMHTANMLGVAELLKAHQAEIKHKIVLIFQPAEEKLPGGGRLIMESGILQKLGVTEVYGLHTSPKHSVGTIALKSGPLMARPDEFILTIKGRGGHAAAPHDAVDPIVIAAQVVTTIQSVVSRTVDPTESAVVTIGSIHGGTVHNVIPEKVEMKGTVRTFRKELAEKISHTIEQTAKGIAHAFGGDAELQFDPGYPAVINTPETTDIIRGIVKELYGEQALIEMEKPIMAGEDFAFYQEEFPGTFFFLGTSSEETQSVFPWHHPKYNADENGMKIAAPIFLRLALS
ncbi:amidohydrolase [bacterium]|nr:MAG: amidohydrolase [bacterium]